jgi:hypothetical protein
MRKLLPICLVLAALLAGCGQSLEQKVVGAWKVDNAKTTVKFKEPKDATAEGVLKLGLAAIEVNLRPDKTCALTLFFPLEGSWKLDGNRISITPKGVKDFKFNGKPVMELNVDASGTSMSAPVDDKEMTGTLVLEKVPAAK